MVLDSTGREPFKGNVLIKGQRIVAVGPDVELSPSDQRGAFIGESRLVFFVSR